MQVLLHALHRHGIHGCGHATQVAFCSLTLTPTLTLRAALRCRRRASAGDTPLLLRASPAHAVAKHRAAACNDQGAFSFQGCTARRFSRLPASACRGCSGCVSCANTRADHACGSRPQHAAAGTSWPTTGRRTDSWPASTALLLRTPRTPATRYCTSRGRHLRAQTTAAALDSTALHAACACCHERVGAHRAAASTSRCCCSGHHLRAHLRAQASWILKSAAFTGGAPPPAGARLTALASTRPAAPACTAVR